MTSARPHTRAWLASWSLIALGSILLVLRYADMPSLIPVYRDASGHATVFAAKSASTVFRIAAMGAAQVAATAVMGLHAGNPGWAKFWTYAALAAAAKTFVECVQYATFGTTLARQPASFWLLAALLPVLVFLALAANLWRTRQLSTRAAKRLGPKSMLALSAALGAWLLFATLPVWAD